MTGLVYLQSGGWSGSGVNIVGDVDIVQRQPLAHRGRDNRFESNTNSLESVIILFEIRFSASPVPENSEFPTDFHIPTILKNYAER